MGKKKKKEKEKLKKAEKILKPEKKKKSAKGQPAGPLAAEQQTGTHANAYLHGLPETEDPAARRKHLASKSAESAKDAEWPDGWKSTGSAEWSGAETSGASAKGPDAKSSGMPVKDLDAESSGAQVKDPDAEAPGMSVKGSDTETRGALVKGLDAELSGAQVKGSDREASGVSVKGSGRELHGTPVKALDVEESEVSSGAGRLETTTKKAANRRAHARKESVQPSLEAEEISPEAAAMIFRALSDENRVRILGLLTGRELCASELLASLDIVQSTMSHHMKVLCETGLVSCVRRGKKSCYSVRTETMDKVAAFIKKWS